MDPLRAVAREMKSLSPKMKMLLIEGAKGSGSYDPEEVLTWVEERMNAAEYATATAFLTWVCEDIENRKFGYGNIEARFKEFG